MEIVDIIEAHDDDYESYDAVNSLLTRFPDIDAIYYTASGMYGGCRRLLGMQGKGTAVTAALAASRQAAETVSDRASSVLSKTGEQLRGVKGPLGQTITLIGFDSVATTLEMLQKGVITATITQQPELQGSLSLTILQDYLVSGVLPEKGCDHTQSPSSLGMHVMSVTISYEGSSGFRHLPEDPIYHTELSVKIRECI